jgi:hypothetical protein
MSGAQNLDYVCWDKPCFVSSCFSFCPCFTVFLLVEVLCAFIVWWLVFCCSQLSVFSPLYCRCFLHVLC